MGKRRKRSPVSVGHESTCLHCSDPFQFHIEDLTYFFKADRLDRREFDEKFQRRYPSRRGSPCRLFQTFAQHLASYEPICREVYFGCPADNWPPRLGAGESLPRGFQLIQLW